MSADLAEARARVVAIASKVLAGLQSPIVASRDLSRLRFHVGVPEDDPDFTAFVAIDSETDALPVGKARQHWAAEALAAMEPEIARAEEWAMTNWRDAFANVVRRFASPA
jgi:hypothetical protein